MPKATVRFLDIYIVLWRPEETENPKESSQTNTAVLKEFKFQLFINLHELICNMSCVLMMKIDNFLIRQHRPFFLNSHIEIGRNFFCRHCLTWWKTLKVNYLSVNSPNGQQYFIGCKATLATGSTHSQVYFSLRLRQRLS